MNRPAFLAIVGIVVFVTGILSGLALSDWSISLKTTNEELIQRNFYLGIYAVVAPFIFVTLLLVATIWDALNSLVPHTTT